MVAISPESVNVSYNSTVTLTCVIQSLTTPNVTWTSNTDVTLPSTSLVSSNNIHTSILTLEQVTLEYIGEYTCTAVNEGGEMSDMININVYGKNMSVSIYMYVCMYLIHLFVCLFVSFFILLYLSSSLSFFNSFFSLVPPCRFTLFLHDQIDLHYSYTNQYMFTVIHLYYTSIHL